MGNRLIDADLLLDDLMKVRRHLQMLDNTQHADIVMRGLRMAEEKIEKSPTVDAEPVRHAHWIEKYVACGVLLKTYYYCSACGLEAEEEYDYCHCGAKMDGGEK